MKVAKLHSIDPDPQSERYSTLGTYFGIPLNEFTITTTYFR